MYVLKHEAGGLQVKLLSAGWSTHAQQRVPMARLSSSRYEASPTLSVLEGKESKEKLE
jgi:hypothetical protein